MTECERVQVTIEGTPFGWYMSTVRASSTSFGGHRCDRKQRHRADENAPRASRPPRPSSQELMTNRLRYPSFRNLRSSSSASSNAKRANRAQGTTAEIGLQRAFKRLGLRF